MTLFEFKSKLQEALFFILILTNTFVNIIGGSTGGNNYFFVSILIFFCFGFTVGFKIKLNLIVKIYSIIALGSILSLIYAEDINFVLEDLPRVVSNFLTIIMASLLINTRERLKKTLNIFIICISILALPNFLFTQGGVREMFWGGVNPVGATMFFGILFSIIMIFLSSKLYIIPIPLFLGVMLLTQSQKVILSLVILMGIFTLFSLLVEGIKKYKNYVIFIFLFSLVAYFFITKTSIGDSFIRTEATLTELQTGESVAGSAVGSGFRSYLITKGIDYALEKPFLGHGLNQYRFLFKSETGFNTYSHNTWLELLVSFGLIVTLIYAMLYLILIKNLIVLIHKKKDSLLIFLLASIITVIIIGQFQKMYYDVYTHMFLLITFFLINEKTRAQINEGG